MGNQNANTSRQNQRVPRSSNQNRINASNSRNRRGTRQQFVHMTPAMAEEFTRRLHAAGLVNNGMNRRTGSRRNGRRNAYDMAFSDLMINQIEQAQLQYALQRSRVETERVPQGPPPCNEKVLSQLTETCLELSDLIDGNEQCVVCFEKQHPGDLAIILPCGHAFHKACIFEWLKRHNTCPVCRMELNEHFNETDNVQNFRKKMEDRRNKHQERIENQKRKLADLSPEVEKKEEELFIEQVKGIEVSKWKIKYLKEFLTVLGVSGIETYKEKQDIVKLVNDNVTTQHLKSIERNSLEKIAQFLTIPFDDKCTDEILRESIQVSSEKLMKGQ